MKNVKKFSHLILGVIATSILLSCVKDEPKNPEAEVNLDHQVLSKYLNLPETPFEYDAFDLPPGLKTPFEAAQDNMPEDNKTTKWGATLGRVLFYDKSLSINNTIACASCHQQSHGFSDPKQFSEGFEGGKTNRHSMGLSNARYYVSGKFFWDERASTLEEQVLMPIQDPVEMGMTLEAVVDRLKATEYYPILFRKAFGDESISSDRMSKALAQFVRSIVSYNSKFDKGLVMTENDPNKPFDNFNPMENRGKEIFFTNSQVHCAGCHITTAMVGDNPRNNGIFDDDEGVYEHDPQPWLRNTFKVPSLKNISVRPPYMHNGAFATLESVIEHYNSELTNPDGTLDPHLIDTDGEPMKMNLSEADKSALKAFLLTLTDEEFLTDPVYADPFE